MLVWSLSTVQVSHLSDLDPPTTPTDLTRWVGANVISLAKENPESRVLLYRQITKLAATALERDQSLLARIEYVGVADVHCGIRMSGLWQPKASSQFSMSGIVTFGIGPKSNMQPHAYLIISE